MSWLDWRDQIAEACDGSHHTIETIEALIAKGILHILEAPGCCLIVELVNYPTERACQVMWAAGDLEAIMAASPYVEAWARRHGCTEMLVESRPGWSRALRRLDYEPWSVTVRKPLHGPIQ